MADLAEEKLKYYNEIIYLNGLDQVYGTAVCIIAWCVPSCPRPSRKAEAFCP